MPLARNKLYTAEDYYNLRIIYGPNWLTDILFITRQRLHASIRKF